MANDSSDLTGKLLGTCRLEKLLGQGGMGAVYLARQLRPSRLVAVKVLQVTSNSPEQKFLARFRREADVIAQLEHVNIVPIYEYGEQGKLAYLVMPYLTGGSLRDVLSQRGPLSLREVAVYLDQAAAALDYAHAHGVIHRDLKPANFLLHADGRLVLADFGIARILEEHPYSSALTSVGTLLGTPEYMAPEMVRGEQIDYRVDIYELGIVLYHMLSGHVPFTGSTPYAIVAKHVQEPLQPLHPTIPSIPPAVDAMIQKATAKRREERYTSVRNMAQALRAAMADGHPKTNQPQPAPPVLSSSAKPIVLPEIRTSQDAQSEPQLASSPTNPTIAEAITPSADLAWQDLNSSPSSPRYKTDLVRLHPQGQSPRLLLLGALCLLLLITGGTFWGLQLGGTTASSPKTSPTLTSTTRSGPVRSPTAPATLPLGTLLYQSASPGQQCDQQGGTWSDFNGVKITCQGTTTAISNTSPTPNLQGTFFMQLPAQSYPTNYVVRVQLQQDPQSKSDFGLYFRNQPGDLQGVYSLLVHPDGTWGAYVYDNTNGSPTKMAGGPSFGDAHAPIVLVAVVNGQHFSFYANGKLLGSVTDNTYASGTAGIAVDQGGTIMASNFALYTLTP